jgi:hypothetical protein
MQQELFTRLLLSIQRKGLKQNYGREIQDVITCDGTGYVTAFKIVICHERKARPGNTEADILEARSWTQFAQDCGPRHAQVQVLRLLLNATKPVYTNAVPWGTTNRPK